MTMTDPYAGFHRQVDAELSRQERLGYTSQHDNEAGLDHLLELAYSYIVEGKTVKGAAMVIAARRWIANNGHVEYYQREIAKFMDACDQEVAKYPQLPSDEIRKLRIKLMVSELLGAVPAPESGMEGINNLLPDGISFIKDKSDELVASMLKGDLVGIADGLADLIYVVIGTAIAYGINLKEIFDEVHRSNMSKTVWDPESGTYTTIKDEDGKVLKPETYSPANITPIIERQIRNGMLVEAREIQEITDEDEADDSIVKIDTVKHTVEREAI